MNEIYIWSTAFPDYEKRLAAMGECAFIAFLQADELELL